MAGGLNFGSRQGLTGQTSAGSTDAQGNVLQAYSAGNDDNETVDQGGAVTANQAATQKVAQATIGGLRFGAARNPDGNAADHKVLDDAAEQSERAGIYHKMTPEGRDKLRNLKSAGTQYVPTAGNYADLFAKNGAKPTDEQKKLLDRLDALEQNVSNTETLPNFMKTDPVGTRMEIAKLKAQLDGHVRDFARSDAEHSALKAAGEALKINEAIRQDKSGKIVSGKTDAELLQALAENTPHKLGQGVTNSDIQREMFARKQLGIGVGPAGRALTPDERKERMQNVLGGLPEQDLTALTEHLKVTGPMAYETRSTGKQLMDANPQDPRAALELQADDTHNRMAAMANRLTGGMKPTIDELLTARKQRLDLLTQNGMTPDTVARLEDTMKTMVDPAMAIMQRRNRALTEAGLAPGDEDVAANFSQLQSAARLQLTARTPEEKQRADKLYQEALGNSAKLADRVDGLTKLPETNKALRNFVNNGEVNGSRDAALLLANSEYGGRNAYERRQYRFSVTTPDGVEQSYAIPFSNPAQSAYDALRPALERDTKQMDIMDNPALNAAYGKDGKGRQGLLPMARKEEGVAEVFKRLPEKDRKQAMSAYTTDMQASAVIWLLNRNLGTQILDKEIQNKLIDTQSGGSKLNAQFYSKDAEGHLRLDMGRLARALNEVGKGDVIDKMRDGLQDQAFRDELYQQFSPQNMREKAMHAYLFGDQAFVAVDKNGIYNGRQTFNTWLHRTMAQLGDTMKVGADKYKENAAKEAESEAARSSFYAERSAKIEAQLGVGNIGQHEAAAMRKQLLR